MGDNESDMISIYSSRGAAIVDHTFFYRGAYLDSRPPSTRTIASALTKLLLQLFRVPAAGTGRTGHSSAQSVLVAGTLPNLCI